jgi:hypothetical protein
LDSTAFTFAVCGSVGVPGVREVMGSANTVGPGATHIHDSASSRGPGVGAPRGTRGRAGVAESWVHLNRVRGAGDLPAVGMIPSASDSWGTWAPHRKELAWSGVNPLLGALTPYADGSPSGGPYRKPRPIT